ncbi:MAG: bifunctional riboflavin kinase/FAD synthetase [Anaerolineales bacterium]|nr:bifunctional riboflavin kinase/FAD synthetase [Anaerolineales bacterium]
MQHFHTLEKIQLNQSWLTIGSFDGVHVGHQQIIQALVRGAHQADVPAVVITFYPHPQLVLQNESRPYYLTSPAKRAQLLGDLSVDFVITYPFTRETSQLSAEDFISILHERFHFSELWVGHDFALGKDREGTPKRLREIGRDYQFNLHEIPPFNLDGELVSSSRIRKTLREGDVQLASTLLGRPYEVVGEVVTGENRGKSLGFPTSNLALPPDMINIKPGVYACKTTINGKTWLAVTNIGFRPTFGGGLDSPRIETHILDFSGDLYGEELSLGFIKRLRDEMKFSQVSDLIFQINKDIEETRLLLTG